MAARLYTAEEASELTGLAVRTIRGYSRQGYSDLKVGSDWIVRRVGPWCRRLYLTERGVSRLASHAYRTCIPGPRHAIQYEDERPILGHSTERRTVILQWRALRAWVMRQYDETPCAQPNCPCIVHKLGLPQADALVTVRELTRPRPRRQPHP